LKKLKFKEELLEDLIERAKSPEEINMLSPLTWAYVGDCIYELYIRTDLVNKTKLKPHKLHIETIKYVKAKAQADILKRIEKNLTEKELEIVRRGRNAENHHLPKNADPADYMYSTAFEGLIGYLYLTKQDERLKEIFKMCKE
jgi:ribonuclease-3 family protein